MRKTLVAVSLVLPAVVGCRPTVGVATPQQQNRHEQIAEHHGWLANYKRGQEILQNLSTLGPEAAKTMGITAYRQEKVAFVGGGAPPGGTNDLITEGGFYVRVVNKAGKDLRPTSVWWEVLVRGEVWQVLPENKIIVLEVDESDWIVLQTG
jgi:hypothetical protein